MRATTATNIKLALMGQSPHGISPPQAHMLQEFGFVWLILSLRS